MIFCSRHYNSFGRTYLFDLDFYHIKKGEDDPPKYTVDAYHAGNVSWLYFLATKCLC